MHLSSCMTINDKMGIISKHSNTTSRKWVEEQLNLLVSRYKLKAYIDADTELPGIQWEEWLTLVLGNWIYGKKTTRMIFV